MYISCLLGLILFLFIHKLSKVKETVCELIIDDIDIFENIKAIQIIDIIACIQQTYALRTWSKDCWKKSGGSREIIFPYSMKKYYLGVERKWMYLFALFELNFLPGCPAPVLASKVPQNLKKTFYKVHGFYFIFKVLLF